MWPIKPVWSQSVWGPRTKCHRYDMSQATDIYFKKHGISLEPEFELSSYDMLFDFASKNLGIACVTEGFEKELQNKNVFKLKTDFSLPKRNIGICFLKNTAPSPAVVKLIEMLS